MCISVKCVCTMYVWRPVEGMKSRGTGLQAVVSHPVWVLGTEPQAFREQQVLLTAAPSLQPLDSESGKLAGTHL